MILGISGSGRKNGITCDAVKAVLEASGLEYEFISLSGKKIGGCISCLQCASDNVCKIKDDWLTIGDKMLKADAIVFGAPNYYGMINALGHACMERTYSFRHQARFGLAGKLGVIVSTSYKGDNVVQSYIEKMMFENKMVVVDSVIVRGYSQCYSCGFGHHCGVGKVVRDHGFLEKIEDKHLPLCFEDQDDSKQQTYKVGKILGSILKNRR
ncbi:MAG: flavodoxin family protein [Firmicutes bacterium]|nr:flavodoxin family protein [Bacillota bacterium]